MFDTSRQFKLCKLLLDVPTCALEMLQSGVSWLSMQPQGGSRVPLPATLSDNNIMRVSFLGSRYSLLTLEPLLFLRKVPTVGRRNNDFVAALFNSIHQFHLKIE